MLRPASQLAASPTAISTATATIGNYDFSTPRQLVTEIFGHVASGSGGQSQQGDLHRRRYKNEQNQRTAVLRQRGHLTQSEAVPSAQYNNSRKLTGKKRERPDKERCKDTKRFHGAAQQFLQPLAERRPFGFTHIGLIAERHRPALHRLRIDNGSMFLEVGDRFQNYIFWRFAEAFMRWACRMAGRAMPVHDE